MTKVTGGSHEIRTITEEAITGYVYDPQGNLITHTDPEGGITRFTHNIRGDVLTRTDPNTKLWENTYDAAGNLLTQADPLHHAVILTYDKVGNLISREGANHRVTSYTYNLQDRRISQTDPYIQTTRLGYDDAGRLAWQEHFAIGASVAERTVNYDYDDNNNLTGWDDGSISSVIQYDKNNRKTSETVDYGSFSLSHGYTYDTAGNKQSYTGPDGVTITYHRDKGRLSRIEIPNEGSLYYNSYQWTRPDKITWPGGSTREITYDGDLKPKRIQDRDPGANPLLDYQYLYDKTGNIEQKSTQDKTYDYTYDTLQRLREAASEDETEGWTYDPNGNRKSDKLNPGTWDYDDNDRLLASPGVTYGYDQAGNTVSKTAGGATTTYRYNAEGRLSRIEDAGGVMIAEYAYDPLGRRYRKVTQSETLYFHYTDEGLVGEFDAAGSPVRLYGYRPDSTWTTDPLYVKSAAGYGYYRNDHLGTPQRVVAKSGAKQWEGVYRAFGEVRDETGGLTQRLRFAGQYYDQETGNYYNYFRDYDPGLGRYIQPDPIGLLGGPNIYSYAMNNSIKRYDVDGKQAIKCGFKPEPPDPDISCEFIEKLGGQDRCYCEFFLEISKCPFFGQMFCEKKAELKYAECLRKIGAGI